MAKKNRTASSKPSQRPARSYATVTEQLPLPSQPLSYGLKPRRAYAYNRDGTMEVYAVGKRIRRYARHLEQNQDIAKGALYQLIQFIVGPSDIAIEPVTKPLTGEIHTNF